MAILVDAPVNTHAKALRDPGEAKTLQIEMDLLDKVEQQVDVLNEQMPKLRQKRVHAGTETAEIPAP